MNSAQKSVKARKLTLTERASSGGRARAKSMTPQERAECAQNAANARWNRVLTTEQRAETTKNTARRRQQKPPTTEQRTEIAKKAANARWQKPRVGSAMPAPSMKARLITLRSIAELMLEQLSKDPNPIDMNKRQVEFFVLRTRLGTLLRDLLKPEHHALAELQTMLTIPTVDVMVRIVGILQGCLTDVQDGVLKA